MSLAFDDEFAGPTLNKAQVERRVADWQFRVDELLSKMKTWSQSAGLLARHTEPVKIDEDLMVDYGVPPIDLPTLHIDRDGAFLAKVIPFGLWIIGGNGRVDIKTKRGVYKIVDTAGQFEDAAWRIGGPGLSEGPRLDEAAFKIALDI